MWGAVGSARIVFPEPRCFEGTRVPSKFCSSTWKAGTPWRISWKDFPTVSRELAIQALEERRTCCSRGWDAAVTRRLR